MIQLHETPEEFDCPYADSRIGRQANALVVACHQTALAGAWWVDLQTGQDLRANPMCFAQKLMLVVSELAEAMEGDRKNLRDDKLPHRSMREVELADAAIRLFDLAGAFNMNLGAAIAEKLEYNRMRDDHKVENRKAAGGKTY